MPPRFSWFDWLTVVLFTVVLFGTAAAQTKPPAPGSSKPEKPSQGQPARRDQPVTRDERGTDASPISVKIVPAPKTQIEAAQEKAERDAKAASDQWLVYLTGGLVFVGVVQVFVFSIQAYWLRQTIDVMRDTATRQLRAYVSVPKSRLLNLTGPGLAQSHVIIRNAGQTPAYNLRHVGGLALGPIPPNVGADEFRGPTTVAVLAPGDQVEQITAAGRELTDDDRNELRSGAKSIHVYGDIRYKDAFGHERFTRYRLMSVHLNAALIVCDDGNESN
jgi:hypothetical protein